jgi:hypothetical protein
MRVRRQLLASVAFGTICLAVSGLAQAGSILQSRSFSAQSVPFQAALSFDPFNPALGTLTDVTIRGSFHLTASIEALNPTDSSQCFDGASENLTLRISEADGFGANVRLTATVAAGTARPHSDLIVNREKDRALPILHVPTEFWSSFQSASGNPVPIVATAKAVLNERHTPSAVVFSGRGTASGAVTLEYIYNVVVASPVPAPSAAVAIVVFTGIWLGYQGFSQRVLSTFRFRS